MKQVKLFSIVLLLAVFASVKGFAQDGDDKIVGKATAKSESMQKQFKLSDEQTKSLYDVFVTTMQKENALYASGKSRVEVEAGKDQIHADFVAGVKGIFTADQFAKFDKPQTPKSIKEGAKWRSQKMKKDLNLTKKQTKSVYNLMVSTTTKQSELTVPEGDKTAYYNERIKLDDEFYAGIKEILTEEQFKNFNRNDY